MAIKTALFDSAKYLGSHEAQAELLSDALESGNADYIAAALCAIARADNISEHQGLHRLGYNR